MSVPRCLVALALLAVAGSAAAQPAAPEAVVRSCARGTPVATTGLGALQDACPELKDALAALGLSDALAEGSAEKITPDSLQTLLALQRASLRAAPDVARLEPVLRELREPPKTPTAWERLKQWLQRFFDRGSGPGRLPWLERWLDLLSPGQLALKIVGYALMALVVGAAVFIVVREIRASNWRLARGTRRRGPAVPDDDGGDASADRDVLQRASPAERPRLLFRLVAARLAAAGRVPAARSLTHRELRTQARLQADEQQTWAALAELAERQVYGHRAPSPDDEPLLARAERLWL